MNQEPGNYRNKILIESATQAADASGALVDTYSTFATWWAKIIPVNGVETVSEGKVNSIVSVKMRGRYISGITTTMRAKFGTRIYSIVSVINLNEQGAMMDLSLKEIT